MTFTQLRTFALVAELGSLRAAAAALGVSEPAVSAAVSALRSDLGDPLFRRTGTGIALTPGGRALAARARELVRLAERTRREVAHATSSGRLRALATAACAEHIVGAVDVFARRVPRAGVDLVTGSGECAATALADDEADIVLGPRPVPSPGETVEAVPFLRYARVVVTAPGAGARHWLAGPADPDPGSAEERWADATGALVSAQRCPSEGDALDAVRQGGGLMLALEHQARADLAHGRLVRVPATGTPVTGMWWASVPGEGRSTSAARALQRFLTTPDATSALLSRPERTGRSRPTVRVELWS
jgi:DNA-binding transcriptional LysR family regulator